MIVYRSVSTMEDYFYVTVTAAAAVVEGAVATRQLINLLTLFNPNTR